MQDQQMPAEFKSVARNIAVGVFDFVKSMDDLVAHALIGIDHHHAAVLRDYLPSLIDGKVTAEFLKEFWSTTPSGIHIDGGEAVRKLLAAILDRIQKEPYLTGRDA